MLLDHLQKRYYLATLYNSNEDGVENIYLLKSGECALGASSLFDCEYYCSDLNESKNLFLSNWKKW